MNAILFLKYAKTHRFWTGLISKFAQIFANASAKQTKTSEEPFFQISTSNTKYEFLRSREKISEKTCVNFWTVSSKESQGH
jgi:uncharacterized membrane protein